MNSSPPPPSFTLPPLNSSGQFPVTPPGSHSPSPSAEGSKNRAGKNVNHGDASEDGGRVSMYVKLFEEMIVTVLASESYLFTPREIHVLRYILDLAYAPKYLLTRLLLRRPCKIHPLGALMTTYSPEIGEQGVKAAARTLSHEISIPADLLRDEPNAEPDASSRLPVTPGVPARSYPTPESSKDAKKRLEGRKLPWADLPTGLTPEEERSDPDLAAAIRESMWASRVGRVELDEDGTVVDSPPPERATPSRSVSGSSTSSTTAQPSRPVQYDEVFSLEPKQPRPVVTLANSERNMTLEDIMSCVSADELKKLARARKVPTAGLINRQSTVDALKALASKQTTLGFTPVKGKSKDTQATLPFTPKRTTNSEDLLIKSLMPLLGHGAVQLTPELHSLIGRVNLIFSRTPPLTATSSSLMLPSILVTSHKRRYPEYGPPTRSKIWQSRDELLIWERAVHWESVVGDAMGDSWAEMRKNPLPRMGMRTEMLGRVEGAKVVKRIWEGIWPVWQELVAGEGGKSVDPTKEDGGLVGDRFKTGHVLTRIVYKAAAALGILHDYDLECEVLKALLAQRRWRRSKRGAWYDRLALVLMNHYNATPQEKEEKLMEATQVCIDGLLDEETHMIYRPGLSRRLTRLENKLDLPSDERHISYASLMTSSTRELAAPRVKENLGAPKFRPQNDSDRTRDASLGLGDEGLERSLSIQQTGKSVWVGKDSEVTVEGWVLEWWEAQGYKGYHSEGSIITTLFGLLMWPVLFHSLPGAFETPYQTAPLDLGEDTFAPARAELFETLLQKMSKTKVALEMLRETDDRERARVTWAVGINWEYEKKDLEELVECLGGMALSGICRMLGEEYRHRVSGVPDLIVWHPDKKEARFVEVKGPGDSLSETQKIWIDVLLSSGVPVEVCRVVAKSDKASTQATERLSKKRRATSIASSRRAKRTPSRSEDIPDPEEVEDDEWQYQSGEEGKPEGHWAKDG